jgi:hypothetical protein
MRLTSTCLCWPCLQVGYGADAVCPYLAYDALFALQRDGKLAASLSQDKVVDAYIKSISVGILKVCGSLDLPHLKAGGRCMSTAARARP